MASGGLSGKSYILYEDAIHPLNHGKIIKVRKVKQHGGKRKGAGRKPKEPTKTIRVPVSMIPKIKELIRLK
jgi:hypothetical protein